MAEIDTALMYGGGETEVHLGAIGVADFTVATKANPFKTTPQPIEVRECECVRVCMCVCVCV